MSNFGYPIKLVARRTGLTAHVIRIWEKRYGAVRPHRSATNRRLYSEQEVERLSLLREAVKAGNPIGTVAGLPLASLRALTDNGSRPAPTLSLDQEGSGSVQDECLEAVKRLDSQRLELTLARGSVELGAQGLLQHVIAPLVQRIGDLWREGTLTAAHEHFATAVIRVFLGHASTSFAGVEGAPVLIVATPAGQLHELGALLAAAAAANLGWHVTYLGSSLPAAEIAGAARQNNARAVALSVVYPEDDPNLGRELARLRELLPPAVPLLVGGRAASAYHKSLDACRAVIVADLQKFGTALDALRQPLPARSS